MADKKVYWEVRVSGSDECVGIHDPWENVNIPLDPRNKDYKNYLLLSSSGMALLILSGTAIPSGTTDSNLFYSSITLPVTGSN